MAPTDDEPHSHLRPCLSAASACGVHPASLPGATEGDLFDLAKLYRLLKIQGQVDSIMHSLEFFALGKIRKFI